MAEERGDVTAAMHGVQNRDHIVLHNAVDDDVVGGGEAALTEARFVTPSPHVWIPGQQPKRFYSGPKNTPEHPASRTLACHISPQG
jgi:hypothetical protein